MGPQSAQDLIRNPALQQYATSELAPYVNYDGNDGNAAHFYSGAAAPDSIANRPFPSLGIGPEVDYFATQALATITIPTAGTWTFGVNSDDGFGLTISGHGRIFRSQYATGRGASDTLATFVFPEPGDYNLELDYWTANGGFEEEFFAAEGTYTSWASGGTNWALVGDTAHGGLKVVSPQTGAGWISTQELFNYLQPRVASLYDEQPTLPATSPRQTPQLYDPTGIAANFLRARVADPPTMGGWTVTNDKMGMIPLTVTTIKAGNGSGWNVTTYKAGATGFSVTTCKANTQFGPITTLAQAQSVIGTPGNQAWNSNQILPYINLLNTPSTGSTPQGEFTTGARRRATSPTCRTPARRSAWKWTILPSGPRG